MALPTASQSDTGEAVIQGLDSILLNYNTCTPVQVLFKNVNTSVMVNDLSLVHSIKKTSLIYEFNPL